MLFVSVFHFLVERFQLREAPTSNETSNIKSNAMGSRDEYVRCSQKDYSVPLAPIHEKYLSVGFKIYRKKVKLTEP